ncbi:hypothetical protein MTO96_049934, partial [Rhipicephalus appendiculatus]
MPGVRRLRSTANPPMPEWTSPLQPLPAKSGPVPNLPRAERPCSCVLGEENCSWTGQPEKLADHILSAHGFIPRLQGESVVVTAPNFDSVQNITWFALQTCHGRDFLVMLNKSGENSSFKHFFGVVVLVGSNEDARRFQYRLKLCGSDHPAHLGGQDARHPLPGRECPGWRRPDLQHEHSPRASAMP